MPDPNWDLLRQVVVKIQKSPELLDMKHFVPRQTECGTICCIGGHVVLEAHRQGLIDEIPVGHLPIQREAQALLGLTEEESEQFFFLPCLPEDWPAREEINRMTDIVWVPSSSAEAVRSTISPYVEEIIKYIEHTRAS